MPFVSQKLHIEVDFQLSYSSSSISRRQLVYIWSNQWSITGRLDRHKICQVLALVLATSVQLSSIW